MTAPDPTIQHTYTAAGDYEVTLTVTDDLGQTDTVTQTVTVVALVPLTVDISVTNQQGLVVDFTQVVSVPARAATYAWDFGDSVGTATTVDPSYTYTTPGTYTVTLTVTDTDGGPDAVDTLSITVGPLPVAAFTWDDTFLDVAFDASTSTFNPPATALTTYAWDFGDGTTSP